jgi:hypothetical protein
MSGAFCRLYLGEHFAQVCQQFLHLADVTRRFSWIRAVNKNRAAVGSDVEVGMIEEAAFAPIVQAASKHKAFAP